MREYMAARYAKRREQAILLLGGKCAECDETSKLEVDHIDRSSKDSSSRRWFYLGEDRFMEEMKKCQLLCQQHHTLKTIEERGQAPARNKHGTLSSYRYCRCDECRAAKSASNKAYSRRNKGPKHK